MRSILARLAVAVASSVLVVAQTSSVCNPMQNTCPNDPALAGTYDHVFGGAAPKFTAATGSDLIKYGSGAGGSAVFRVAKSQDAPTIVSDFYIMWGHMEVTMQVAPGVGMVSSIVLQSDDLDEIDWEMLGSTPTQAQSNYFGKGNTATYDRAATHPVNSVSGFHTYGVDWTQQKLDWLIDGKVVRTLTPAQVQGDFYPQTPMQLRIGSWAAGDPGNAPGTIEWAGGTIDYTKGPFDTLIREIKVIDYSSGTSYRYSDRSGSWESIQAVGGKVGAGPQSGAGNDVSAVPDAQSITSRNSKTGFLIPPTSRASKLTSIHPTICLIALFSAFLHFAR